MSWSSRLPDLLDAFPGAVDTGLVAGGAVLTDAVKEEHRGGFTSGDFVTGRLLNSIYATEPATEAGVRVVRVTTSQTDPPVAFYWTFGHINLFSGRYERVDHWTPATAKSADAVAQTFVDTVRAELAPYTGAP